MVSLIYQVFRIKRRGAGELGSTESLSWAQEMGDFTSTYLYYTCCEILKHNINSTISIRFLIHDSIQFCEQSSTKWFYVYVGTLMYSVHKQLHKRSLMWQAHNVLPNSWSMMRRWTQRLHVNLPTDNKQQSFSNNVNITDNCH